MQIAPIRSPLDLLRVQSRLASLRAGASTEEERVERAALEDAVEHYRCITERHSARLTRPRPMPRVVNG